MERKPPVFDFIERDAEKSDAFWVEHEELGSGKARFVMKKPTHRVKATVEQMKGMLLGTPNATIYGDNLADYEAHILCAFEASPFVGTEDKEAQINLDDVIDDRLIHGVWSEVQAYWATFRVRDKA